jgi:hypothetical protein
LHPGYNEHEFCAAVEFAFEQWETLQNTGSPASAIDAHKSRRSSLFPPQEVVAPFPQRLSKPVFSFPNLGPLIGRPSFLMRQTLLD